MKDYQYYQYFSADDFVLDDDFQKWVLKPNQEYQHYWANYLLLHPEKEKEIEQAKIMVRALDQASPTKDTHQLEQEWNLLNDTINQYERRQKQKTIGLFQRYGIAASILLCLIAGSFWWYSMQSSLLTYSTDFNETRTITLPDGSTVILNANSTLSFDKDWQAASNETSSTVRKVMLDGEAYFMVEKQQIQQGDSTYFAKFIVQTDRIEVEVLGTRFNVNDHIENTQVTLESGKVLVRNDNGESLYLDPGEIVELTNNQLLKKVTEVELYTSWKDNKLIFEETPVPEILEMIELRYGYQIEVNTDYLDDKLYTGSSPADDAELLIYKLSRLYNLSVKKEGKELTINANKF
ncbi:FecR family protein [Catalinimonas niigatensis]|uniref:FecR family protein n=1 Tax=Catalinimonas niigatensis TaxID=1397264 RepID=UPI002666FBB5|nr:FecR domain-containing protein [Catalinimonas niigatensis]WPP50073.1 FecR domain-containing protein [Catalinimonas niigatensis]